VIYISFFSHLTCYELNVFGRVNYTHACMPRLWPVREPERYHVLRDLLLQWGCSQQKGMNEACE